VSRISYAIVLDCYLSLLMPAVRLLAPSFPSEWSVLVENSISLDQLLHSRLAFSRFHRLVVSGEKLLTFKHG